MKLQVLTKKQIRELRAAGTEKKICDNLEFARQVARQRQRDRRRKRGNHSGRSTKFLSLEQFASVIDWFETELNNRERTTRMIIILMAEAGLRSAELADLKMKDLPVYHGKSSIEVRCGKGGYPRTIVISRFLRKIIEDHAGSGWTKGEYFLKDERGTKMSYAAMYARVKKVFNEVGLPWAHNHTLRHTFTTHLKTIDPDNFFLKHQLGHRSKDPTDIYAGDIEEISRNQMERFHNRLWCYQKQRNLPFVA